MIPGPLIFILWVWMYSNGIGPINYFLVDVFHVYDIQNQPTWLGSTNTTFISLALMEWWWGLGFHTMFYLAGLSTIPKELYESARVMGRANGASSGGSRSRGCGRSCSCSSCCASALRTR